MGLRALADGLARDISVLLMLIAVGFLVMFFISVFSPRHQLGLVSVRMEFNGSSVTDVHVYLSEVGTYVGVQPYAFARGSWNMCSNGYSYVLFVDGSHSYGPFCLSGIGSLIGSFTGSISSTVSLYLPPGKHVFKLSYSRDGKLVDVATFTYVVPTVDQVKLCGGVWPCGGGLTEAGQAG